MRRSHFWWLYAALHISLGWTLSSPKWKLLWPGGQDDNAPLPVYDAASAGVGKYLFVHGGSAARSAFQSRFGDITFPQSTAPIVSESRIFDTGTLQWQRPVTTAPAAPPLMQHCACYIKSTQSVWVFGGWNWARVTPTAPIRATDRSELWRVRLAFATDNVTVTDWSWELQGSFAMYNSLPSSARQTVAWPRERRRHACACGIDRMYMYGGIRIDGSAGIRTTLNDVWELVPFLGQVPKDSGSGVQYSTDWVAGWRRLAFPSQQQFLGIPSPRYSSSAVVAQIPWWYGSGLANGRAGQGQGSVLSSYAFLDVLILAGGLTDGRNIDINTQAVSGDDATWVMFPNDAPPVPPASTLPVQSLPGSTWLPSDQPNRSSLFVSFYAVPPRNGTWFSLRVHPDSQSGGDGLLNRWDGSLGVLGGDTLVWLAGQQQLDPTIEAGASVGRVVGEQHILSLSIANDVYAQVQAADLANFGHRNVFWPASMGWSVLAQPAPSTPIPISRGTGATWSPAFTPRYGLNIVTINATTTRVSAVGSSVTNGGGSMMLAAFGGCAGADKGAPTDLSAEDAAWPLSSISAAAEGGPSSQVWLVDMTGVDWAFTEASASTFTARGRLANGFRRSREIGLLVGVAAVVITFMTVAIQQKVMVRILMAADKGWMALTSTRAGACVAPVLNCLCTLVCCSFYRCNRNITDELEGTRSTGNARQASLRNLTAGEIEEAAQREAEERRRGVSEETLSKLPTLVFSTGTANDSAGSAPAVVASSSSGAAADGSDGFFAAFRKAAALARDSHVTADICGTSCPICLLEYEEANPLRRLPCGHFFHAPCVDQWLKRSSKLCPMCKHSVLQGDVDVPDPARSLDGQAGRSAGAGNTAAGASASFASLWAARIASFTTRGSRPAPSQPGDQRV